MFNCKIFALNAVKVGMYSIQLSYSGVRLLGNMSRKHAMNWQRFSAFLGKAKGSSFCCRAVIITISNYAKI